MTMKRSKPTIPTKEGETEEFEFNTKVRWGDGLAITLFDISLEVIFKGCNLKGTGIRRIHNWREKVQDRKSWKRITKEAETSKALQ